MRTFGLTAVLLGGMSIAQMWPSPSRQWWGVITDIEPGKWIAVANEMSDPVGFRIALTSRTQVDGDPSALRRQARVTVLYASTGGGAVARRVRIVADGTHH
jgi:hypothetical protein